MREGHRGLLGKGMKMASERKMGQHLELLNGEPVDLGTDSVDTYAEDEAGTDNRFQDVDDILDRLTVNTKAVEKK